MNVGDSSHTIDLTPGTTTGVLYDGMTADGTKVFFTTADQLDRRRHRHQRRHLQRRRHRLGSADPDPGLDRHRRHRQHRLLRPGRQHDPQPLEHGRRQRPTATSSRSAAAAASPPATARSTSSRPEQLDGASNGVQDAPNLYVASPGSAPHFIRTLESSANAPLPPPAHPFLRSFGTFANPPASRSTTPTAMSTCSTSAPDIGTGYVHKFDSAGHPIDSFGNSGKLTVAGRDRLLQPARPRSRSTTTRSSPNYRRPLRPRPPSTASSNKFDPSGDHLADISTGGLPDRRRGRPGQRQRLRRRSFFGESVSVYRPQRRTRSPASRRSPTPTGVAVDSAGNVYVVNGGGSHRRKGTTEKYNSSGTDLGQLDGEPLLRGVAVDPLDDHVYVDEGNRVVEFDSAGKPVGAPIGVGPVSRARSASPPTPATLAISQSAARPTSRSSARR